MTTSDYLVIALIASLLAMFTGLLWREPDKPCSASNCPRRKKGVP